MAKLILPVAAIACAIALSRKPSSKDDVSEAVEKACQYVEAGISMSFKVGQGNGPINHFHSLSIQPSKPFSSSLRKSTYQSKHASGIGL